MQNEDEICSILTINILPLEDYSSSLYQAINK